MSSKLLLKPAKKAEKNSYTITSKTVLYMDFNLISTRIAKTDQDLVFYFKDLSSVHLHSFYDYYTAEEVPFFILNASSHHVQNSQGWEKLHNFLRSRTSCDSDSFLEAWGISHDNPCFDASHDIESWLDPRILNSMQ